MGLAVFLFVGLFAAVIDAGQATFAGFPELVVQVDTGVVHSAAYHIVADITRSGEEIA